MLCWPTNGMRAIPSGRRRAQRSARENTMPHKTELHPDVVDRILARRGKMHVHDTIDAKRTALVSIDMQVAFLGEGLPSEVPMARAIVPNINRLAAALRAKGGTVVWVYSTFTPKIFEEWSAFLGGTYAGPHAK